LARKKIVFVIVEGPSDEEALAVILNRLYDVNKIYFHVMHRDITCAGNASVLNILSKVGEEVRQYAKENHYTKTDFNEIIHIVDMDGAYVSNDCIIKDTCEKPTYDLETIRTTNPDGIIKRNLQKSSVLSKICTTPKIWDVPYLVFYMSCNLDHVLHNKLNSSDEEKEGDSYQFAKTYKNDLPAFLKFICESDFSVISEYRESWEFIKQGKNSLNRHTNLGLYFQKESENK
jgi:hypothetical protein